MPGNADLRRQLAEAEEDLAALQPLLNETEGWDDAPPEAEAFIHCAAGPSADPDQFAAKKKPKGDGPLFSGGPLFGPGAHQFDPKQPRVPAGQDGAGEWTDARLGAHGEAVHAHAEAGDHGRALALFRDTPHADAKRLLPELPERTVAALDKAAAPAAKPGANIPNGNPTPAKPAEKAGPQPGTREHWLAAGRAGGDYDAAQKLPEFQAWQAAVQRHKGLSISGRVKHRKTLEAAHDALHGAIRKTKAAPPAVAEAPRWEERHGPA